MKIFIFAAVLFTQMAFSSFCQTPEEFRRLLTHEAEAVAPGEYKWKVTRITQGNKQSAERAVAIERADKANPSTDANLAETYKFFAEERTESYDYVLSFVNMNKWKLSQTNSSNKLASTFYYSGDGKLYNVFSPSGHVEITDASPYNSYTLIQGLPEVFMQGWLPDYNSVSLRREGSMLTATALDEKGNPLIVLSADAKSFKLGKLVWLQSGKPRERVTQNGNSVLYEVLDQLPDGSVTPQFQARWEFLGYNRSSILDADFKLAPGCTVTINTATTHLNNVSSDDILLGKKAYDLP